jgi:Spy/CpxP family protein refolding chaperone
MRDEVQQELQLVDEQLEQVTTITEESRDQMRDEMRNLFSEMRDLSDEERRARFDEIRSRFESMNAEFDGRLKKVLLPHQFERLKQIDVQVRVQQRGADALTSGELAEALNLTAEQQEKLEERAEEVQQELRDKVRELQLEARNKLLDVLTPEQRSRLEQMMGDAFQLQDDGGRFGRGGFFGGRGGRGRDRGGERGSRSDNDAT